MPRLQFQEMAQSRRPDFSPRGAGRRLLRASRQRRDDGPFSSFIAPALERPKETRDYDANLWVHGHVHESFEYRVDDAAVVCDPRGYMNYRENDAFAPVLTISVS